MSRLRGPICTYCGSSDTFAYDAHPERWSCRTCDSDFQRSIDNLHWGKQYVLGHGGSGWATWRQRPFENPDGSGMTVDKFNVIASYPYGQTGWHEAWGKSSNLSLDIR